MGWGAGARTPARLGHTLRGLLDVGGDPTEEASSLAEPAGHLAAPVRHELRAPGFVAALAGR